MPLYSLPTGEAYRESEAIAVDVFHNNLHIGREEFFGVTPNGEQFQFGYILTGRSPGSQNRIFVNEGQIPEGGTAVRTLDPDLTPEEMAQVENANLIYYRAMRQKDGLFVVTNGAQTDPVFEKLAEGVSLHGAISNAGVVDGIDLSSFEPDPPNDTSRIAGFVDLGKDRLHRVGLGIIRKNEEGEAECSVYQGEVEELEPGKGLAIQTYDDNDPKDRETPLPSYNYQPYAMEILDEPHLTAQSIWNMLYHGTRSAIYVRAIDLATGKPAGHATISTRG